MWLGAAAGAQAEDLPGAHARQIGDDDEAGGDQAAQQRGGPAARTSLRRMMRTENTTR
ncbi:hypothetical protein GCM10009802_13200 [Streptomyces synnematoformans]|uniref:Uncharacterized protein n=1 Tax=Streptomyces synnematoformans TaxID=415721 RepID=A0ABP5JEH4_9ACTN